MLSLYTTEDKIIQLYEDGPSSIWYRIMNAPCTEISYCTKNGDNKLSNHKAFINLHRAGCKIFPDDELMQLINDDESNVRELPNPIYLIDIDSAKANEISKKYGVIVLPKSMNEETRPAIAHRGWSVDSSEDNRSWKYILSNIETPLNSVMIIDRYLFANQNGDTIEDSIFNLREIIGTLLPLEKVEHFNITIIFDLSKSQYSFEEIKKAVQKMKRHFVDTRFAFDLELISVTSNCFGYDDTHDRYIISNYFIVGAPHKLKTFSQDRGVLCKQTISFNYLFSQGIEPGDRSTKPIVTHDRIINAISKVVHHMLYESVNECDYSLNGQIIKKENIEIKNELFLFDS